MSSSLPPYLRANAAGALLTVHAQPRASRTALVGLHGDALKIAVQAPPVDSAANEAIRDFLAELCGLSSSRVELRQGQTARRKVFQLGGLTAEQVVTILAGAMK